MAGLAAEWDARLATIKRIAEAGTHPHSPTDEHTSLGGHIE